VNLGLSKAQLKLLRAIKKDGFAHKRDPLAEELYALKLIRFGESKGRSQDCLFLTATGEAALKDES
jgi:hypothetical protein